MMITATRVIDDSNDRQYFTVMPNLVDDIGLSPFAFRLYMHLKRVAGESGECWQSTRTLATKTKISVGKISSSKTELQTAGLITIHPAIKGRPSDTIRIVDIWGRNTAHSQRSRGEHRSPREHRSPHERECSPGERECSPHERECSPGEPINNLLTITHEEEHINNNNSGSNGKNDPVVVVDNNLPKTITDDLAKLGWVGSKTEIITIYEKTPQLIIDWLDYTLNTDGLGVGFFRNAIRSGEYPPELEATPQQSFEDLIRQDLYG